MDTIPAPTLSPAARRAMGASRARRQKKKALYSGRTTADLRLSVAKAESAGFPSAPATMASGSTDFHRDSSFRRRTTSLPDNLILSEDLPPPLLHALVLASSFNERCQNANGTATVSAGEIKELMAAIGATATAITSSRSIQLAVDRTIRGIDDDVQDFLVMNYTPAKGGSRPSRGSFSHVQEVAADSQSPRHSLDRLKRIQRRRVSTPHLSVPTNDELTRLLSRIDYWDFDIFGAAKASGGQPLLVVAFHLFQHHALLERFDITPTILQRFLMDMEKSYRDNPYHNNTHGADVAQGVHVLITQGLGSWMTDHQTFAAIVSALGHDIGHIGVNNPFLVETRHPLAIRYNDRSPLENMHIARIYEIAGRDGCNIFDKLSNADFKSVRKSVVQMILATDNEYHFTLLADFSRRREIWQQHSAGVARRASLAGGDDIAVVMPEAASTLSAGPRRRQSEVMDSPDGEARRRRRMALPFAGHDKDQLLILQIALHAADVSNPAKPWDLYIEWTNRLVEEFYALGDKQREKGIDVTAIFDRHKPIPLPKFQIGFMNAIVHPLYCEMSKLPGLDCSIQLQQVEDNMAVWKKQLAESESRAASPLPTPSQAPATSPGTTTAGTTTTATITGTATATATATTTTTTSTGTGTSSSPAKTPTSTSRRSSTSSSISQSSPPGVVKAVPHGSPTGPAVPMTVDSPHLANSEMNKANGSIPEGVTEQAKSRTEHSTTAAAAAVSGSGAAMHVTDTDTSTSTAAATITSTSTITSTTSTVDKPLKQRATDAANAARVASKQHTDTASPATSRPALPPKAPKTTATTPSRGSTTGSQSSLSAGAVQAEPSASPASSVGGGESGQALSKSQKKRLRKQKAKAKAKARERAEAGREG